MNLSTFALIAALVGWAATTLIQYGTHKVDLRNSVNTAISNTEIHERKECASKVAEIEDKYNAYADDAVAAGTAAAAGAPKVIADERVKLCAVSPFCRKEPTLPEATN